MLHNSFFNYVSPRPQMEGEFILPRDIETFKRKYPFSIDGFGGHKMCPALDFESCFAVPIKYFTFLRNPIDRFLSHVNWQINVKRNHTDIAYYLEEPYFHNFQCYRLSGKSTSFEAVRELVERKQVFLGLMERYVESLFFVQQLLPGFRPLKIRMNDLSSSYSTQFLRNELGMDVIDKIIDVNQEDLHLYEYAKERFASVDINDVQYGRLNELTNLKRKVSNRLSTFLLK